MGSASIVPGLQTWGCDVLGWLLICLVVYFVAASGRCATTEDERQKVAPDDQQETRRSRACRVDPALVGAWRACAGNSETGDPDGEGDEAELTISAAGELRFGRNDGRWYDGGGGPYDLVGDVALPFAVTTPDGERIAFSLGARDPVLIAAAFGYATPATIWYRKKPHPDALE